MRTPLKGGSIYGRGQVLTATGKLRLCIDPSDADTYGFSLDDSPDVGPPPTRGTAVTGTITHDWKITLRRLR